MQVSVSFVWGKLSKRPNQRCWKRFVKIALLCSPAPWFLVCDRFGGSCGCVVVDDVCGGGGCGIVTVANAIVVSVALNQLDRKKNAMSVSQ